MEEMPPSKKKCVPFSICERLKDLTRCKLHDINQQNQQQLAFRKTIEFLCKLEVILQPVQHYWEQLGLQLNIDQFTLHDIKNKEDSSEQMKGLLEWVVKRSTLTQFEEALHTLGNTDVISGFQDLQTQMCTQTNEIEHTFFASDEKLSHYDVENTINLSGNKDQVQVSETANKCIQCDYWNSPKISDSFEGMMTVGRKLCSFSATTDHELIVEECGLKVIVPAEVILPVESKYELAAQGIWGGKFEFPEFSKLVSGVCYVSISSSSRLNKPVTIELEHCAYIANEKQTKYLCFVVAKSYPPFKFKFLRGGSFSSKSRLGRISLRTFSVLAIVNIFDCFKDNYIVGSIVGGMVGGVSGASVGFPTVGVFLGGTIGYTVSQCVKAKRMDCIYQAHIFRKSTSPKEWDVKFVVTQDTNYSKNIVEGMFGESLDYFGFRFKSPLLRLTGFPENFEKVMGWTIKPRSSPPVINKKEVDIFSSSNTALPPCISIRIQAVTNAHDFCKDLEYSLNVEGIQRAFDERLLQGSSQPQIDIIISLDDHIHSTLSTRPDENKLFNLLVSIDSKWFEIGSALNISHNNLQSLRHNNESDRVRLKEVINTWITSQSSSATWKTVIDAIDGNIVENKVKANEIREHLGLPK